MNNEVTSSALSPRHLSGGFAGPACCAVDATARGRTGVTRMLANEAAEEHRSVPLQPPVFATLSPWRRPAADTCQPDTCRSEPCRPELPAAAAPCGADRRRRLRSAWPRLQP